METTESTELGTVEGKTPKPVSFLFKELITCGAVISTFELVQALRRLGVDANIVSYYQNTELEKYFGVTPIKVARGVTVAVSPLCAGEYAYVRTKDDRWISHKSKKIAVSKYIADWIKTDIIIGNGTHERFYDRNIPRDIDVLICGNYEPNKNIEETVKEARKIGGKIAWFGRRTKNIEGVERFDSPSIEEIAQLYSRAKNFISFSKSEGWGRPIAEAKACGVPNVINKNGGNQEIEIVTWESIAKQFIKEIL